MELRFGLILNSKLGNEILTQAVSNVFTFFLSSFLPLFRLELP